MTMLAFLGAVAAIVVLILVLEVDARSQLRIHRPTGLLTWISSGNWPAKVGGALIIVGVGALLRFAALQIHAPPISKLIGGVFIALGLGFGSAFVTGGPARRAVSLCLGGAGFGVAYLTAYSAFGLFDYVSSPTGLALLGLTSVGAGVYAVTRSALSLAVLSMIGAFLGPAFAVDDPGPTVVYGYYVGASLLTLAMVALRGWRPLIHLSFLFTLAGGIFFAWTSQYYTPEHSDVMLPMLVVLAAVHVAMPIIERSPAGTRWIERLDLVYTIALPTVVALLAAWIAPTRLDLAAEFMCLGAIWAVAATVLQFTRGRGIAAHGVIAALLLGLGVAARFRDLPWELISLAFAVAALAVASRRPMDRVHQLLAGLVALFGAVHILMSLGGPDTDAVWIGTLVERLVGASLLIFAGIICRRIRQALDTLLLAIGVCWALIAIGLELIRHELALPSLVVHGILLIVVLSLWIPGRKLRLADRMPALFAIAVAGTGIWAAVESAAPIAWVMLFISPLALIAVAIRPEDPEFESSDTVERPLAAMLAAAMAGVWAVNIAAHSGYAISHFPLACAAAVGVLAMGVGRLMPGDSARGRWVGPMADVFGLGFATLLVFSTAVIISRDPSAVVLEVLALAGLGYTLYIRRGEGKPIDFTTAAFIVALGLVVQANLMRLVGMPGDQNILGILDLQYPAVTSLLWASAGSALTIWSRRVKSRALWVSGAVLLVASAVKLVLFDFGSLGQLANILAVIAAGGMFLLVGWLAPMPPAAPDDEKPSKDEPPSDSTPSGGMRASRSEVSSPAYGAADARTSAPSETPTTTTPGPARAAHASAAASDAGHTPDQPHPQHGLFEYAEAQSRRTARGDVHVASMPGKRSMTDEELNTRNRRTAWTLGIIVVVLVLIASGGSHHALNLLRVIG